MENKRKIERAGIPKFNPGAETLVGFGRNQTTISVPVRVDGYNIFFPKKRNYAVFRPAEENSGLTFISNGMRFPAKLDYADDRRKLGGVSYIGLDYEGKSVDLVEHLLSAVYGLGIDNLDIELSDGVCPTVDSCAEEYVMALKDLRVQQDAPRKKFKCGIEKRVDGFHRGKPATIEIKPAEEFILDYRFHLPHKVIGDQSFRTEVDEKTYQDEIMSARAPGFLLNKPFMRFFQLVGLLGAHGVNSKNYLLIGSKNDENYGNPEKYGVRYNGDEAVRHKALDFLGTLPLIGAFEKTEFRCYNNGHRFDIETLKKFVKEGNIVPSESEVPGIVEEPSVR